MTHLSPVHQIHLQQLFLRHVSLPVSHTHQRLAPPPLLGAVQRRAER